MDAIPLQDIGAKPFASLFGLAFVLPLGLTFAATSLARRGATGEKTLMIATAVLLLTTVALAMAMRRHRATLDGRSLRIASSFYTLTLQASDLAPGITVLEPGAGPRIGFRTNGVALPGYRSGWYRAKGGGKLFAVVTGEPNLNIPTRRGFNVLLSVADPALAVDQLSRLVHDERQ